MGIQIRAIDFPSYCHCHSQFQFQFHFHFHVNEKINAKIMKQYENLLFIFSNNANDANDYSNSGRKLRKFKLDLTQNQNRVKSIF